MGENDNAEPTEDTYPSAASRARDVEALRIYTGCRDSGESIANALLAVDTAMGDEGIAMMKAIRAYERVDLGVAKKLFYANRPIDHPKFTGHGPDGVPSHR